MQRIPELELMDDEEQAAIYAGADFSEAHDMFVSLFGEIFKMPGRYVLDLGCGPGDVTFRFARAFVGCIVHGIDGAEAMLECARKAFKMTPGGDGVGDRVADGIAERVRFIHGVLPSARAPLEKYDAVISNSLLHHLRDPMVLWRAVIEYAAPGAPVFIMDLRRPGAEEDARKLVETHAPNEHEILKRDFYNSLLAAYKAAEIAAQLDSVGLGYLSVREVGDRHVTISGYFKAS